MPQKNFSVKLDETTCARLLRLSEKLKQSRHSLMVQAILQFLTEKEAQG